MAPDVLETHLLSMSQPEMFYQPAFAHAAAVQLKCESKCKHTGHLHIW